MVVIGTDAPNVVAGKAAEIEPTIGAPITGAAMVVIGAAPYAPITGAAPVVIGIGAMVSTMGAGATMGAGIMVSTIGAGATTGAGTMVSITTGAGACTIFSTI